MKQLSSKDNFLIVQIATVCVFAGRAYQHIFWDAPYREIIWDPNYTEWAVKLFSDMSWDEFVTHPMGDIWIQRLVSGMGFLFLLCAIAAFFIRSIPKWGRGLLFLGGLGLMLLAAIYAKDKFFHIGQFFEYSLQFGAPLFLYYLVGEKEVNERFIFLVKLAIAFTFTCHGLYALGYYPYPGTFLTMTINILGTSPAATIDFLNLAGVIDFIVAVGIFLPNKWAKWALAYCVFWGFVTSLARIVGNFYPEYPLESLHQWVFEAIYRAPHFLLPFWVMRVQNMQLFDFPKQLLKRNPPSY
jgi:hypothetical protein